MSVHAGNVSTHKKEKLLRGYARLGLGAHGVVYCLMALLSLFAALGYSKSKTDKGEAFKLIHEQPFGKVLLVIIAVCMLGYVLLRFFQAFKDTRHKGKGAKGLAQRFGYACIALTYLSLSIYCFKVALDKPSEGDSQKMLAAKVLELPAGEWILGGIAIGFAIAAVYQMHRGLTKRFMKEVDLYHSDYKETFTKIGTIGYTARGIVFGIIAYLFFRAALESNSSVADGTDGAFVLMKQKFGALLLAVMSIGLLAFGIFMFIRAKHEKMNFDMKE